MHPKFKILHVAVDGPHAAVQASLASPETEHFTASSGSCLGGARLKSFLHESPGSGIFTFEIENPLDASRLRVGGVVELVE